MPTVRSSYQTRSLPYSLNRLDRFNQPPDLPGGPGVTLGPNRQGQGAFGTVPGEVSFPFDLPGQQLQTKIPNLQTLNQLGAGTLQNWAAGVPSDSTLAFLQDRHAGRAVGAGMPGTNVAPGSLMGNLSARDLGRTSEALQGQFLQSFGPFQQAVGQQIVPFAEQLANAYQEAVTGSAPDPTQAGVRAENLFSQALRQLSAGGGSGGGSGGGRPQQGTVAQPPRPAGFPNPVNLPPQAPAAGGYDLLPQDVPYQFGGDPARFIKDLGIYQNPEDVPYWYSGDPSELVR